GVFDHKEAEYSRGGDYTSWCCPPRGWRVPACRGPHRSLRSPLRARERARERERERERERTREKAIVRDVNIKALARVLSCFHWLSHERFHWLSHEIRS